MREMDRSKLTSGSSSISYEGIGNSSFVTKDVVPQTLSDLPKLSYMSKIEAMEFSGNG